MPHSQVARFAACEVGRAGIYARSCAKFWTASAKGSPLSSGPKTFAIWFCVTFNSARHAARAAVQIGG
jgi:hypothetical protein